MSWLKKVSGPRNQAAADMQAQQPRVEVGKERGEVVDADAFVATGVSEKVIAQYGASLKGSIADMKAIADVAQEMEPHRAAQLGRALDTFYQRLGKDLSRVPADQRNAAAQASVRALRGLVEKIPHDELAGSAVSAMTDLLRYVSQSIPMREVLSGQVVSDASKAAEDAVVSLMEATRGRAGAASSLNIFPNIVWQVENVARNAGAERFARWGELAAYVADTLPKPRIDQIAVAKLGAAVSAELEKDPKGALDRARKNLFDEAALGLNPARGMAANVPAGVVAGQASGVAWDAMSKAMIAVLDGNPAGPGSLGAAIEGLAARLTDLVARADDQTREGWTAIAGLLTAGAKTPAAESLVRFLADNIQGLVENPAARAQLIEPEPNASVAATLVRARAAELGADVGQFKDAFRGFDALPPATQMQVALAALPHLPNAQAAVPLLDALSTFAKHAPAAGQASLDGFAQRFAVSFPQILNRVAGGHAAAVATAIARANPAEVLSQEKAEAIAATCAGVAAALPDAPLDKLIADDADKRPGLITLSNTAAYRFDPRDYLGAMLRTIAPLRPQAPSRIELLRHAMHLAGELGKLDRDPGNMFQSVTRDLQTALQQPDALHFAMRAGGGIKIRAGAPKRKDPADDATVKFLREHPELPPELALTAGVHFSNDQLTWLLGQITGTKSRAQIRNIRDAIFASMEAGRGDLIEVLRNSKSSPAAIAGTMTFIAAEYRGGRLGGIPWDSIVDGLNKGEDPAGAIDKERARVALAALNVAGLEAGRADPAGLEILKKVQADINGILAVLPAGQQAYGVPSEKLRDPFMDCLRGTVDGTWPAGKYESEIGRRQLAKLTPQQRAIWMSESVTPLKAQPAAPLGPELADAMTILKGLGPAIRREARLAVPGMQLAFDTASRDLLRGEIEKLSAEIHQHAKGTPEHIALSKKMGPMLNSMAVIQLVLAVEDLAKNPPADAAAAITELKATLIAGKPAARKLGARGSAEAIQQVIDVAPEIRTSPKTGIYCADEDRVDAYVTAFDGGCMKSQGGGNQGGQIEFITGAQYKMVRTCSGEVGATRSIMRLLDVDMPNYKGPAIWLDGPYPTNRGVAANDEMYKLAYKHALKKAMAMGVPFLFGPIGYGDGRDAGKPAMAEMGVPVIDQQATVTFDIGRAGLHHCQSIFGDDAYWVHSPGYNVAYVEVPADKTTYSRPIHCSVVMPPGR